MQVESVRVWKDFLVPVAGLGGGDDTFASLDELCRRLVRVDSGYSC